MVTGVPNFSSVNTVTEGSKVYVSEKKSSRSILISEGKVPIAEDKTPVPAGKRPMSEDKIPISDGKSEVVLSEGNLDV